MAYGPMIPLRDDSLDRAAKRILAMLEQEELARINRQQTASSLRANAPRYPGGGGVLESFNPDQARVDYADGDFSQQYVPASFTPGRINSGHPGLRHGIDLAQAAGGVVAGPGPFVVPPVAQGGTKENDEFVRQAQQLFKWLREVLQRSGSGTGGGREPDCDEEWEDARRMCIEELSKGVPDTAITGGYFNVPDCARGLVSERCGGNKVEWKPRKSSNPWKKKPK
jgi:hypothetical protein